MDRSHLENIGLLCAQADAVTIPPHTSPVAAVPFPEASAYGEDELVVVGSTLHELERASHSCRRGGAWSDEGRRLLFLDVDGVLHPLRIRILPGSQVVDTSHCFAPACMKQLQRVVNESGAELVLSSSWRAFNHSREAVAVALGKYGLGFCEWTTTAGGESCSARVDQILEFVGRSTNIRSWAVVDDDNLVPSSEDSSNSMMRTVFRERFVRTNADSGIDAARADQLIRKLLDDSDSEDSVESECGTGMLVAGVTH